MTKEQIEQMPAGPEINALIQAEIFGAIPLTAEEYEIFKSTYLMTQGPHSAQAVMRPCKVLLDEPEYYTKLEFRLEYPRDYSGDQFGCSRDIVDKMRRDGYLFSLFDVIERDGSMTRAAEFMKLTEFGEEFPTGKAKAETDALAISRAALIAKIEEEALNKRGEK